jgi:hypothetical protein
MFDIVQGINANNYLEYFDGTFIHGSDFDEIMSVVNNIVLSHPSIVYLGRWFEFEETVFDEEFTFHTTRIARGLACLQSKRSQVLCALCSSKLVPRLGSTSFTRILSIDVYKLLKDYILTESSRVREY